MLAVLVAGTLDRIAAGVERKNDQPPQSGAYVAAHRAGSAGGTTVDGSGRLARWLECVAACWPERVLAALSRKALIM